MREHFGFLSHLGKSSTHSHKIHPNVRKNCFGVPKVVYSSFGGVLAVMVWWNYTFLSSSLIRLFFIVIFD